MSDFVDLIPYETTDSPKEVASRLARIIGIPEAVVPRDADHGLVVASIAGLIIFRHIETHQRREVMLLIDRFKDSHRPFYGQLQGKVALVIAQPRWEKWSLSNKELQEIVDFHQSLGRFSGMVGANPGAYGVGATVWQIIKHGLTRGNVAGFVASVVLVGMGEASHATEEAASRELARRTRQTPSNPSSPFN
ncbi:hypothetical protein [Marinobacter sp.]|uniref:hypothetical protein n=1 Tax=Marinobacter sp. TaxID=50741 RepID=UPI00384DEA48